MLLSFVPRNHDQDDAVCYIYSYTRVDDACQNVSTSTARSIGTQRGEGESTPLYSPTPVTFSAGDDEGDCPALGPPLAELGDDEGDPLAPPLPFPDEGDGVFAGIRVEDEGDCPALGPPLTELGDGDGSETLPVDGEGEVTELHSTFESAVSQLFPPHPKQRHEHPDLSLAP